MRIASALLILLLLSGQAPATAQERPSQRYAGCRGADERLAGVCAAADDVEARLGAYNAATHRRRWAELHYALGMALYAIGVAGDETALRDSIAASRTAAEYYTRARTPSRWSAIQMHITGALLSLGDEASVAEAVEVARGAAETVNRADQPQLWASVHASLGDALLTHAQQTGDRQSLIEAADAMRAALEIYRRPAFAEQRARAERLLEEILNALGGEDAEKT